MAQPTTVAGLPALVLTVSDGVDAGTREDRSGEVAENRLLELGFHVRRHYRRERCRSNEARSPDGDHLLPSTHVSLPFAVLQSAVLPGLRRITPFRMHSVARSSQSPSLPRHNRTRSCGS